MPESLPLVSVVIPNYNYARYLPERIASVLRQTFTDYELILLDDASTDDSLDVMRACTEACDHEVRIVPSETNSGSPFVQWMKGIRLARGKYVWIAEADDLAEPTLLETCVSLLEGCAGASICYVGSKLIDENGQQIRKDPNRWGWRRRKAYARHDGRAYAARNLYWKNYIINASAVVFRQSYALSLADSEFQSLRYSGDWLFWFEMALQGDVIEVYQVLNAFRQHRAKVTMTAERTGAGLVENIRIAQLMEERLPELSVYRRRLCHGRLYGRVMKKHYPPEVRSRLLHALGTQLGASEADYRLAGRNQWLRLLCPCLPTRGRDRL